MKICLAQLRSAKGDIAANTASHQKFVLRAVEQGAELVIFPELSLTGYEPTLAHALAMELSDERLSVFQPLADNHSVAIGVGVPIRNENGVNISLVLFEPAKPRALYSKKYLHADEKPYFESGANFPVWKIKSTAVSLAICYELSVREHSEQAFKGGGQLYLASAAKTAKGVEKAYESLSTIARRYAVPALMCNGVGPADNFVNAGGSAVWSHEGELLGKLGDSEEGLLVFDTGSGHVQAWVS